MEKNGSEVTALVSPTKLMGTEAGNEAEGFQRGVLHEGRKVSEDPDSPKEGWPQKHQKAQKDFADRYEDRTSFAFSAAFG